MGYLVSAIAFLFVLISLVFIPAITDSMHETLVETYTDVGNITTGAAETTGNITLTDELYRDRLTSILVLDSSLGADTVAATAYDATTRVVDLGGLAASNNRLVTIQYEYDVTDEFINTGEVIEIGPVVVILSLISLVIAIPAGMIYAGVRRMKGR